MTVHRRHEGVPEHPSAEVYHHVICTFGLGSLGSLQRSLSWFKGALLLGEGEGKKREGKGREGIPMQDYKVCMCSGYDLGHPG